MFFFSGGGGGEQGGRANPRGSKAKIPENF